MMNSPPYRVPRARGDEPYPQATSDLRTITKKRKEVNNFLFAMADRLKPVLDEALDSLRQEA